MHCEAHPLKAWHYTDRFRARFGTVHWETARTTVGISTSCVGAGPAASMALASKLLHATSGCDHMVAAVDAPVPGSVAESSPTLPFGKTSASAIEAAGPAPTQEVLMPTVIRALSQMHSAEACSESVGVVPYIERVGLPVHSAEVCSESVGVAPCVD